MNVIDYNLHLMAVVRRNVLETVNKLTTEQLNKIPENCNNNIVWQMGHILVTQQAFHYKLAGIPTLITNEMTDLFKNGTRPTRPYSEQEIEAIKVLLQSTQESLKADLAAHKFDNYHTYTVGLGATISNIEEALAMNNIHEGLHFGSIMLLKKLV